VNLKLLALDGLKLNSRPPVMAESRRLLAGSFAGERGPSRTDVEPLLL
jgi:hypothetical protein